MKQRLLIALLTVLVFCAGFAARVWTECEVAVPPAPPLGSEFVHSDEKKAQRPAFDRAKLIAEIEQHRSQIDAYQARLDEIDHEVEVGFIALLTPEQKKIYDAEQVERQKARADRESRAAATPAPLTDEQIAKARQRPFETAFWKVCFTGRLTDESRKYSLDAKQQDAYRELLRARRDKYLALVDATPPPSFRLSQLAKSVQRLAEPSENKTAAPAEKK